MKKTSLMIRSLAFTVSVSAILGMSLSGVLADSAGSGLSTSNTFSAKTGKELYETVCQACHMAQGKGAVGAGYYPALANNETLAEASYPIYVLLNGLKGMPPVGEMMSDEQIADVVAYIRTNFGNDYQEPVTAQDVADNR
ncbi:c-type cytochrome [Brucellaceae bacterium C25G]